MYNKRKKRKKYTVHNLSIPRNNLLIVSIKIGKIQKSVNVSFQVQHNQMLQIIPNRVEWFPNASALDNRSVCLLGKSPGHSEVLVKAEPNDTIDVSRAFIRVTVANSLYLITLSDIVGWLYFVAWSVSFYPQLIKNFQRKSVIGLNFDFVTLNVVGFFLYTSFNAGLYWNSLIQHEYARRYPRGQNPVKMNDVLFSGHASILTTITLIQCYIYERGHQKTSNFVNVLLTIYALLTFTFAALAQSNRIHWLDFLYFCSYVKLSITLIKYIPQAVMNYRRKSTSGWSIGNVLLDFTGGWLSMMQMILDAYNFDDWESLFGDPTKFGLGLFSVLFDILFMLQHYVFYRRSPKDGTVESRSLSVLK